MPPGWSIDSDVERDWLCLRIARVSPTDATDTHLADALMTIAAERNIYRLILEFQDGLMLTSLVASQLVVMHKRVHLKRGVLRLCGLSDFNRDVLRLMGVMDRFHIYSHRAAAVID